MKILPQKPFTWLLLAFIAYAYISYYRDNPIRDSGPVSVADQRKQLTVESADGKFGVMDKPVESILNQFKNTDTGKVVLDAIAQKAVKDKFKGADIYAATAQEKNEIITLDKIVGKGSAVQCGSVVTINYEIFTEHNIKIDGNTDAKKPMVLTIGSQSALKGLENGVLGMRKGGKRKIAVPSNLAYDDPNFKNSLMPQGAPILIEVDLLSVDKGIDVSDVVSVYDISEGSGEDAVICGSDVNIVYKSQKGAAGVASFKIGDGDAPVGLERGVLGMKTGGKRKIVIPSGLTKARNDSILQKQLQIPNDGSYTIEVELTGMN